MSASRPRTVFTGLGLITPLGATPEAFWQALLAGQSGIKPISLFDASGLPARIAGEISDFDAKKVFDKKDRKSLKMMARAIQLGVSASLLALKDADVDTNRIDPTRVGIDFGAALIASELEEMAAAAELSVPEPKEKVDLHTWGAKGMTTMPPLWMLKYLPNMPACHISILANLQGPSNTVTEDDVAPLLAMAEAQRILQRGQADVMLTGGTDSRINILSLSRLTMFSEFSQRNDEPTKACRPFDAQRDGKVLGEGAGILVLEELEHAQRRGAKIYGELLGCGASFDRQRDGSGLARAITAALSQAGVGPDQIDHVNAQGFSTRADDVMEARGIAAAFAGKPPPVWAVKASTGSMGAAGGSTELAASLLALQHGQIPGTLNCDHPDPECPISVPTGAPRPRTRDCALKVSFTPMGQCAAAVVRRWTS
ncbi:MAG TPA: beta-ketoacyl-[acyl-carrier-protein] synthase family protein [Gemmatales bacterium]|nr:beta-ketoacyl-[acyl-carrier-protein] synthase family protein [Gemmatales bacterium]HMP59182.1 beta-ketoacyl-[acyl-carrier-protein] synthase family protein [Gemmatales bacterium]